jgi:hypothetical protein
MFVIFASRVSFVLIIRSLEFGERCPASGAVVVIPSLAPPSVFFALELKSSQLFAILNAPTGHTRSGKWLA